MKKFVCANLWLAATVLMSPAISWACECTAVDTRTALDRAEFVFVGEIISVTYEPASVANMRQETALPNEHIEKAVFSVKKAWKGVEEGQSVVFNSTFQGRHGLCGDSFLGRSALVRMLRKGKPDQPSGKAKTWLIFISDKEPHSLSLCDVAAPMETEEARKIVETLDERMPPK